ncbi:hypothetical protein PH210_17270 [Paenibacillus sp. BSR1-1]|nr:hypothetical protein [Paenibacillus sp. BSR1-1]MDN3017948.1 hypothetical protein [Paenibacillus sp. BSR1-1]
MKTSNLGYPLIGKNREWRSILGRKNRGARIPQANGTARLHQTEFYF